MQRCKAPNRILSSGSSDKLWVLTGLTLEMQQVQVATVWDSISWKLINLGAVSQNNKHTEWVPEATTCVPELNSFLTKRK